MCWLHYAGNRCWFWSICKGLKALEGVNIDRKAATPQIVDIYNLYHSRAMLCHVVTHLCAI